MRKFNELSALWRAPLFSRALYQDAAVGWRGIGLRFLLLLEVVTWLAVLIRWTVVISGFLNTQAPVLLKDWPAIKIAGGVASSDVAQPYIMRDAQGTPVFVLDTTGVVTDPSAVGARVLLTQNQLVQKDATGALQRTPLTGLPDSTIDQAAALGMIRTFRNATIPVGLPLCTAGFFAVRLVMMLIFAAIGLAFNGMFKGGLSYAALLRLAVLSMAGPVLMDTVLTVLGVPTACWGWFLFNGITLGYLAYAVKVASAVVPAKQVMVPWTGQGPPAAGKVMPTTEEPPVDDQFP